MCQLTFINIGNKNLNKIFAMNQMLFNTETQHKDGYGIFQPNDSKGLFKSEKTPHEVGNFGIVLGEKIKDHTPILAHVRQATIQTGKAVKEIKKEHSHPFECSQIILAHNGSLEIEDKGTKERYKKRIEGKIDSEAFAFILNDVYSRNLGKPFIEIFNDVVSKFSGKFAFIIYNKYESKYYIIRGFTAKLYISYIREDNKNIGYVVNTDDTSLTKSLDYSTNIAQLIYGRDLSYTKPLLLNAETIYKAEEDNLYELGKTKETFSRSYSVYTNERGISIYDYSNTRTYPNNNIAISELGKNESKLLLAFIRSTGLSPEELNLIFMIGVGTNLLSFDKDDFEIFTDTLIPLIEGSIDPTKKSLWLDIKSRVHTTITNVYNTHELQFPYYYNSIEKLEKVLKTVEKTKIQ